MAAGTVEHHPVSLCHTVVMTWIAAMLLFKLLMVHLSQSHEKTSQSDLFPWLREAKNQMHLVWFMEEKHILEVIT